MQGTISVKNHTFKYLDKKYSGALFRIELPIKREDYIYLVSE